MIQETNTHNPCTHHVKGLQHIFAWKEDGARLVYTNVHFDKFKRLFAEDVAAFEQQTCLERLGFDLRNAAQQEQFLRAIASRGGTTTDWHDRLVHAKNVLLEHVEGLATLGAGHGQGSGGRRARGDDG